MSPDADGYPTEDELKRVREWPESDPPGWLNYVVSIWHFQEWGVDIDVLEYHLSTGGWSGNEEIISEMQKSRLWWHTWQSTRRGGHYTFLVPLVHDR